ncbi:hypothetical protein C482_15933 [Natrialba chahannaoensis JCM 10990]|uniref:Uncharacterized protein n=1 Tax=Natrialba chahannaoensis JCM 10990 TaxID=1227492 RepID=M0ADC3_9EURY|nr:hypothetical protein [Natrialba chahannaoensis]ELY96504.1 hypothetical protein C482_15933 [Natrialba chahannaoensis JCM 10990]
MADDSPARSSALANEEVAVARTPTSTHKVTDALVRTGPIETNVNDLRVMVVEASAPSEST